MKNFRALHGRLLDLTRQVDALELRKCDSGALDFAALGEHSLASAKAYLKESEKKLALWENNKGQAWNIKTLSEFFENLICGQVIVDSLRYPQVDPNIGWVEYEILDADIDMQDEVIVNTQLMRLYLKGEGGGGIVEFDYKPRKTNLISLSDGNESFQELIKPLIQRPGNKSKTAVFVTDVVAGQEGGEERSRSAVTVSTPDIVAIKCKRGIEVPIGLEAKWKTTLVKDFIFRSGIGAHCPNATTGFSVSFSFLGPNSPPPEAILLVKWNLSMPSGISEALSIRPLSSVGGISSTRYCGKDVRWIDPHSTAGGLYGVRLVDGIMDFHMDIRCSKELLGIYFQPNRLAGSEIKNKSNVVTANLGVTADLIKSNDVTANFSGAYGGTSLTFALPLRSESGEFEPGTFFVSIL